MDTEQAAQEECLYREPEFVVPVFTSTYRIGSSPYTVLLVRAIFGQKGRELTGTSVAQILGILTSIEREVIVRHYALHHGLANSFKRMAIAGDSNAYSIGKVWNLALWKMQGYAQANKIRPVKVERVKHTAVIAVDLDSKSVRDLPLTPRTRNTLLRAGVATYAQLNAMETNDISFIKHMGPATLREVLDFLGRP